MNREQRDLVRIVRDSDVRTSDGYVSPRFMSERGLSVEAVPTHCYLSERAWYDTTPSAGVWDQEARERDACFVTGVAALPSDGLPRPLTYAQYQEQQERLASLRRHEIVPTVLVTYADGRQEIREVADYAAERDRRTVARVAQELSQPEVMSLPSIHIGADDS